MSEGRIFNFSAGPSMLPEPVLKRVQNELMNYEGCGMSVMEMSHRSKVYDKIITDCEANLRKVLGVPDNYKVLFLQGGASGIFCALPMNLCGSNKKADYTVSGNFSGGALKEAKKFLGDGAQEAGTTKDLNFTRVPTQDELKLDPEAAYVHVCYNNTIYGTKWHYDPETGDVPLIADMSSCILSEPIDVSRYGIIYGGAQKNMAPAGFAFVAVREDLIGDEMGITPKIWSFKTQSEKASMINTPPTFPIYVCNCVLEYLLEIGGLEEMKKRNVAKSSLLYDYLDSQDFYTPHADKIDRSMMNVTFRTPNDELDKEFVAGSVEKGFTNLKGHRSVGGLRASIYNAMPYEGVEALVDYMKEFAAAH